MPAEPTPQELLGLYDRMCLVRFVEERVLELRKSEDIVGSVHLCNGQEAICVGTTQALDLPRDLVFPTYRGHGWGLSCGLPPEALFAELLGRATGVNGGRGGSAYHFAPQYGMYGENSIVGAGTVIASGAALAARYDGSGRITVAVIGDGAMNQGAVHEALNFASYQRLPVLFVVENNTWSELTPVAAMVHSDQLYKRASPYGIQAVRIDGNDVWNVLRTMRVAVERIRAGEGPVLIEAMTARIVGHYIGDPQAYRRPGELDDALSQEPLVRTRARLESLGVAAADLAERDERLRREVHAASERALAAPLADTDTVLEHLYA
ncbi:thiamine pyrophosphate-dependent dehydrogenase E1 component subunit alpha [Streptomyces sp. R39]|uniref:Thiamine pyrophosphate-dependent dehydrogenase E1 component subunit alpha n=1 Tax=Streptomyces sp. R39 TaxID=3238631 RepID=A0AB39QYC1_9ACTN